MRRLLISRAPARATPSRRRGRSRAGAGRRARAAPPRLADDCGQSTTSPSCRGTPSGSCSRPSIGKASASVSSSTPRCSRFSARISSGPTNARPSSPSWTPSAASTSPRQRAAAPRRPSAPLRFATSISTIRLPARVPGLLRVVPVGLHDPLHELVPDDVLVAEADERDAVDRAEDVLHLDRAPTPARAAGRSASRRR